MAWISRNGYLNQSEMENNADIVIAYYRSIGIADETIAGILGNMQAESTINPGLYEVGGQGYGIVQWTPQSVLISHCNILGLSPYTDGDVQIQVIPQEIDTTNSNLREWYTSSGFISHYYNSGATTDMIDISPQDFLNNTMGWTPDKLAIMFMAGYERPSYDPNTNHYTRRMQYALDWYTYMGGIPPVPPTPPTGETKRKFPWVLYARKFRNRRNNS